MKYASVGIRYFTDDNEYHDDKGKVADIYSWYDKNTIEVHRSFVDPENLEEGSTYYTVHTVFEDIPKDIQEALKRQSETNLGGFQWLNL